MGVLQAATPASPLVLAPVLFVLMAQYGWRAAAVSPSASGLLGDATGSYRLACSVLGVVMRLALLPVARTHPEGDPPRVPLPRVAT